MLALYRRRVTILSPLGIHLRAADEFVRLARQFQADLWVRRGDNEANGKSVLELITLTAEFGTTLELEASGTDAGPMLAALCALVAAGFGGTGF
jgi:phosphocarrier protein HPr